MNIQTIINEFNFKAIKSSGPGGQHVNKTSSKVLASFHIQNSKGLNDDEKKLLCKKLCKKISTEGYINFSSSNSRSQHQNKIIAIDRLIDLIRLSLAKKKSRKKTKPSKASIEKRLQQKKKITLKKINRKLPKID
jgi:ribosome-associated protein